MSSAEGTSFSWMVEAAAWEPRGVYSVTPEVARLSQSVDVGLFVDMSVYFRKCAATQLVTGYPTHKVRVTWILYCK